jgi:FkbM family methyltransferase
MRLPTISYRILFFVMVVTTAASVLVTAVYSRRAAAAAEEADRRLEMNPVAISLFKYRDKNFTFTVENYGYVYKGTTGELIDDCVLTFGAWEKFMLFFMEDYVKAAKIEGTSFVDVGANTGQHTLFMAPRIKEVHAIEPFPPVLKRLHENIGLNKFANVKVHEVGFGEKEDELPFFAPDESNQGGGTFRPDDPEKKPFGKLKVVAGDEYFKGVPMSPIGLIKMDIEGYEEPALKGLRQTMERDRPLVIVEVTTGNHQVGGSIKSFDQLKGLFPANYEFLTFEDTPRRALDGKYDVRDFAPIADHFFKHEKQRDLIAVPAEKMPVVPRRRAGN